MKILLIGCLLAAAVIWGLPKIRNRAGMGIVPTEQTQPTATDGLPQPGVIRSGKPSGGPGDSLLPRVRQLEEQLRQFKNNRQKKD